MCTLIKGKKDIIRFIVIIVGYILILVSTRGLIFQQEISLVLAKTPPMMDNTFTQGVTHLYANKTYARDERHAITFCFLFFVFGLKHLFS